MLDGVRHFTLQCSNFFQKLAPFRFKLANRFKYSYSSYLNFCIRKKPHFRTLKFFLLFSFLTFYFQLYLWGARWGSNPRPPESQSGILTNWTTSTIIQKYTFFEKMLKEYIKNDIKVKKFLSFYTHNYIIYTSSNFIYKKWSISYFYITYFFVIQQDIFSFIFIKSRNR